MLVTVRAKLRQPVSELIRTSDTEFIARVTLPPENSKANNEIIGLLAKQFNIPKRSILLVRGAKSKTKTFEL